MEFIGRKIKKRRLSKKYSLKYVSSELKITQETLKNIEDDSFISTNKDVFLLGHIRSYANFLDLNSTVIIEEFKLQNSYEKIDIKDQIPKPINYNNFNIRVFLSFASVVNVCILSVSFFIESFIFVISKLQLLFGSRAIPVTSQIEFGSVSAD